jgi:hypothetical protein
VIMEASAQVTFRISMETLHRVLSEVRSLHIPIRNQERWEVAFNRFTTLISEPFNLTARWRPNEFVEARLIELDMPQSGSVGIVDYDPETGKLAPPQGGIRRQGLSISQFAIHLARRAKERIYNFRAERFNVSECRIGPSEVLAPDAHNLPDTLHLLQTKNPARFKRYVGAVRKVFPDIHEITIMPIASEMVRINLWFVDPMTERSDLAVPLADCGTGISQVLAILYVVLNCDEPHTIIIDEPQSFLHPGAIRKLIEILKGYPQHQFILTTHSPTVVTAANPESVIMLRREGNETRTEVINVNETDELREFLEEIGARLSDVFGADDILWVEGATEERCFPKILQEVGKIELLGTEILGVKQVGDLQGRHKKAILEIYQRLSTGRGLLPPAVGFCFDQEDRSPAERLKLTQDSGGLIEFLPRRMYENYLLHPQAIATVLNEADAERPSLLAAKEVSTWMHLKGHERPYVDPANNNWEAEVDSSKLLIDLFNDLSGARVAFDTIRHCIKLTDWIIENEPSHFQQLADFLTAMLKRQT